MKPYPDAMGDFSREKNPYSVKTGGNEGMNETGVRGRYGNGADSGK